MSGLARTVRHGVSLPIEVAAQVRKLAKTRNLSASRLLLELIENGLAAEARRQEFFALTERFRNEGEPEAANRLGDELGRTIFGD